MADSTTPIDQVTAGVNAAARVNENFDPSSPSMLYGRRASTTSGLNWGFYGGRLASALIANGQVTLTASNTNYVVADRTTGVVSASTSITNWNDTGGFIRLYLVVTGASTVSSYQDHRQAIGAASSGGGGLTDITETKGSTGVNTPTSVVSLTNTATEANSDIVLAPKGTGAVLARTPDGTATGGNKRGAYAVDLQRQSNGAAKIASGANAFLAGGYNNTASALGSAVVAGRDNVNSGNFAFLGAGFNQTLSGNQGFLGGGGSNTMSADYGVILGGSGHTINAFSDYAFIGAGTGHVVTTGGTSAVICGGANNTATGQYSAVLGGQNNRANGLGACVPGGRSADTRGQESAMAFAGGTIGDIGWVQTETFVRGAFTNSATVNQLTAAGGAASATNQVGLPNNSCFFFESVVVARENATGDASSWKVEGFIKRGASAATTAFVGTPTVTMMFQDAGAAAWVLAAVADTTNGALRLNVTGEAAKTIRWSSKTTTTEQVS